MDYSKICKLCSQYKDCAFISRDLQNKCDIVEKYENGYEQGYADAIEKACDVLWHKFDKIYADPKFPDKFIKNFRKAMEGGEYDEDTVH
ncbi:MAG: hypothetical protein IJ626_01250 [Muribaculaceae bacterium]|nr:hypothetical protein [Muribaculaceae bacterium]